MNLKDLERRAYRSVYQDGLWDIYLGLIFLGFGLGPLARNNGMSDDSAMLLHLGVLLIAGVILWGGKRFITVPRMGFFKPGPARKRKILKTRLILLGSVVLGLVIFALLANDSDSVSLPVILVVFSLNILVVLGLMAYYLDYDRLYLYAVLFALSLPVGVQLEEHAGLVDGGYVYLVTASAVLLAGIVMFVRFLRAYPVPPEEELPNGHANA